MQVAVIVTKCDETRPQSNLMISKWFVIDCMVGYHGDSLSGKKSDKMSLPTNGVAIYLC